MQGGDPAPWLRSIARREAYRLAARPLPAQLDETAQATRSDPAQEAAVERVGLLELVGELSGDEQEAVLLHYWGDLTVRQVALRLGVPHGTAKIRIFRARSKLSRLIASGPRAPTG